MRGARARWLFLNTRLVEYRRAEASAGDGDCSFRDQSTGRRSQGLQWTVVPHALRTRAADKCADDDQLRAQRLSTDDRNDRAGRGEHRSTGAEAKPVAG